jgi:hypothetical protein
MGKRFSGSVLHQISASSMWGPFPTRKPKNNFSSFLKIHKKLFREKSFPRALLQKTYKKGFASCFKFFGIQNLSFKKGFGPRSAGLGAAPQLLPPKIQPQPHSAAVAF